jgi:hypothetical protein
MFDLIPEEQIVPNARMSIISDVLQIIALK